MYTITPHNLLFLIIFTLFFLGILSTLSGLYLLIFKSAGKDVHTLANQTSRLVQKGLAEEVAGLVGNASSLLDAINQLVKNTAGVGVFLTIMGLIFLIAAGFLTLKIYTG